MPAGEKALRPLGMRANSARIVVKLRHGIEVPYADDVASDLDRVVPGFWRELGTRFPGIRMRRIFTTVSPERTGELEALASRRDAARESSPPDLLRYFFIDARSIGQAHEVASHLSQHRDVFTLAYVDPPGAETANGMPDDACGVAQGYLRPAPRGIDADFAARLPGGGGEGQHFVDLEAGWTLAHERLRDHGTLRPLAGDVKPSARRHGTAVLGVVCGRRVGGTGCTGIAPRVASMNVVSVWHDHPSGRPRDQQLRQTALLSAIDALALPGETISPGVLLLEQVVHYDVTVPVGATQTEELRWDLPLEAAPLEFELVSLATRLGITVVEAAGNGFSPGLGAERRGIDLDRFPPLGGPRIFDRRQRDSGAILVAAAYSAGRRRIPSSNFGTRVDCFAWGDSVVTATSGGPDDLRGCTAVFGGTSAAAAIVAGAALVVLGVADAARPSRPKLTGREVRELLGRGTRPARAGERIGVMPDLRAILSAL
ncbi:MAG TPA: S8 family serine peptidase [Steroidobacteraceae bacterium]|nr:S8 family serine peptidase [Steroidobacteraceae bacterium]